MIRGLVLISLQSWLSFSPSQTPLPFRDATSLARLAESWKVASTLVLWLGILVELWFLGCSAGASHLVPFISSARCLYQISVDGILAKRSRSSKPWIVQQAFLQNGERSIRAVYVRFSKSLEKCYEGRRTALDENVIVSLLNL